MPSPGDSNPEQHLPHYTKEGGLLNINASMTGRGEWAIFGLGPYVLVWAPYIINNLSHIPPPWEVSKYRLRARLS